MQRLILPIQKSLITAGYKNIAYKNKFGFSHYGQDFISIASLKMVFASGEGTVLLAGTDGILGNVLAVLYRDVYNHETLKTADLVLRYYHLASILVKVGDMVRTGTPLGIYGNTGRYSAGPHLHIEADYDTKYFSYSATLAKSSTIIKAGSADSMPRPAEILHTKLASPEKQSCVKSLASFGGLMFVVDKDLPVSI